jgi:hypothetical protein
MRVGGTYRFRAGADQRIGLKRLPAWKPPADFSFQGHWATADGMGGTFIAEADSAVAALEATATFGDLLEFHIVPCRTSSKRAGQRASVRLDRLSRLARTDLQSTGPRPTRPRRGCPGDPGVHAVTYLLWQSAPRLEAP